MHFDRPDADVILTVFGYVCPHLRSAFYVYTSNGLVAPRHAASYGWPSDPAPITPNQHTPFLCLSRGVPRTLRLAILADCMYNSLIPR